MQIRAFPLIVGGAAGALDGVLADADHKAGRLTNTTQWSTYFEAAAVVGGYLADNFGFSRDVAEPLIYGGLFKLASRGGAFVARKQMGAYAAPYAIQRAAAMQGMGARGAAQIVSADTRRQPAGVLA